MKVKTVSEIEFGTDRKREEENERKKQKIMKNRIR